MEKENIKFNCTGFLNGASYIFDLPNFLWKYQHSFGNAEELKLNLEEVVSVSANTPHKKSINISPDGKSIAINISNFYI